MSRRVLINNMIKNHLVAGVIIILLMLAVLLISSKPAYAAEVVASGNCGAGEDMVTWSLNDEGTLTIAGEGKMVSTAYQTYVAWYTYRESITRIVIEEGVTEIGDYAFYGCQNVTEVIMPNSLKQINDYAFYECSGLREINIPENVEYIYSYAFYNCSNLEAIFLPEGLKSIGPYPGNTFYGCSKLQNITIPSSVNEIASQSFYNCSSLSEIVLQDGLTSIGMNAFYGCSSLKEITIPTSVTAISNPILPNCKNLESLTIPFIGYQKPTKNGIIDPLGAVFGNNEYEGSIAINQFYYGNIDTSGNLSSQRRNFYFPESLKTVKIEGGFIPYGALSNCTNITNLSFGEDVTEISFRAVYNCTNIKKLTIPSNITKLDEYSFYNCTNLESLILEDGVSYIGDSAFYGCASLKSLVVPDSVTYLGNAAFSGCSALEQLDLSNSLTVIRGSTFSECTALKKIVVPNGVSEVGYSAFYNCNSIEELSLPSSLKGIGYYAFYHCTSLKSLTIPEGVTNISGDAFYNCKSLTYLHLPDSLKEIGPCAFQNAEQLKDIYIPNGVTDIGQQAFDGSKSAETIVIPETVKNIDAYAFRGSTANPTVTIYMVKGSHADTASSNVYPSPFVKIYIYEPEIVEKTAFDCKFDKIILKKGSPVKLIDYIASNQTISITDLSVNGYDTSLLMYDDGMLAPLGEGETIVTVHYGSEEITVPVIIVNDTEEISSLSFINTSIHLSEGDLCVPTLSILPENAIAKTINWESSDETIATVENGLVTAVSPGNVIITAYLEDDPDIKATCSLTIDAPLKDIIVREVYRMEKGDNTLFRYYTYPYDTTDENETIYVSSNTDVLTIDSSGYMEALDNGVSFLTIKRGDVQAETTVIVYTKLKSLALNETNVELRCGNSIQLEAIKTPSDATEPNGITWTSSKESVAKVDQNGLVTAYGKGIATITASAGDITATCTIVCPNVPMTGISLPESVEIGYGQDYNPELTFIPFTTTDDKTATWQSSDERVFTVSDDGTVTPVGLGTATLTATVGEFTASSEITVVKGTPEYTAPESVTANCKQTLSEISLPDGFTWVDPDTNVGSAGTRAFNAVFTPSDTDHYDSVNDISITVKVYHNFSEEWTSGDDGHWHACACGEKSSEAEHSYGEWDVTEEPTCTETGKKEHVCTVCGYVEEGTVDSTGHDWFADYTVDQQPTCTEAGSKSIHCKTCNAIKDGSTEVIPALGHTYADTVIEPTCSQGGHTLHVCGRCGDSYQDNETAATGHTFGEWVVDTDSTCTTEGIQHRECTVCGYTETKGLNKKDHSFSSEYTVDKEATCTTDGSKSYHCTNAGCSATTGSVVIPTPGHVYTDTIIEPTCSQGGYTLHICGRCNSSYRDNETAATGHAFGEWVVDTDSTCTTEGIQHRECTVCGYTEMKCVNKKDHNFSSEYTVDKEATCITDGSKSYHCTNAGCSAITGSVVISATGHRYSEWTVVNTPTCTEAGLSEHECTVCHEKETIMIPAAGHKWMGTAIVFEEPTCTKDGAEGIQCKVCNEIKEGSVVTIPAKGHSYSSWDTTKEPTCTELGMKQRNCMICGKKETAEISAVGHKWDSKYTTDKEATCETAGEMSYHCKICDAVNADSKTIIKPLGHEYIDIVVGSTCSHGGYTIHICRRCEHSYKDNETQEKGHTFGEWLTDDKTTCTSEFSKHRTCSVCGFTETEGIDETAHAFSDEYTVDQEPTYDTDGSKSFHCMNDGCNVTTGSVVISVLDHDYRTVKDGGKPATCDKEGKEPDIKCILCEDTITGETIPALGHDWGEWTVTKEATTTEEGVETRTCKRDPSHTETRAIPKKEATVDGVMRIFGASRYDTSIKSADALKEQLGLDKFDNVIIACGTNYADALAGSYLSCVKKAPILLVRNRQTEITLVQNYIKANLNQGGTIYLLGGSAVVPDASVAGLSGFNIERLWGKDRYETNVRILEEAGISGNEILVASGTGFADSLSASATGKPILLVKNVIQPSQKAYVESLAGKKFYLIGGTGAVNADIEKYFRTLGSVTRLGGATRFDTSVKVAETFFANPKVAVLAYGQDFPDGLCGGSVANAMGGPLLLATSGKSSQAAAYAKANGIKFGAVLGGPTLINDAAVRTIFQMSASDKIVVK